MTTFETLHGVRYGHDIFKKHRTQVGGETPGGRYAQNSRWPPLKTKKVISRLILREEPIVIPLFQGFSGKEIRF